MYWTIYIQWEMKIQFNSSYLCDKMNYGTMKKFQHSTLYCAITATCKFNSRYKHYHNWLNSKPGLPLLPLCVYYQSVNIPYMGLWHPALHRPRLYTYWPMSIMIVIMPPSLGGGIYILWGIFHVSVIPCFHNSWFPDDYRRTNRGMALISYTLMKVC